VFDHNSGLQSQSVVYSAASLEEGAERTVVLDPNTLSADGTVSLATKSFSRCGRRCAYGLSASGSDWITGKVLEIDGASGAVTHLPDTIEHAKFTGFAWTSDASGFFYARYPAAATAGTAAAGTEVAANTHHQLWYHAIGTSQAEDVFCFATPEGPTWILGASVSEDGRFLWLTASEGCDPRNKLYYVDLEALAASGGAIGTNMPVVKLVDDFIAAWEPVANDGAVVTLQTNADAPRYKLVRVDLDAHAAACAAADAAGEPRPGPDSWRELVPQSDAVLEWATAAKGDALLLCYQKDAANALQLHSLADGRLRGVIATPIGAVRGCAARREDAEIFFTFASFLDPGVVYRFDTSAGGDDATSSSSAPLPLPNVVRRSLVAGLDPEAYATRQVFVASKDGTRVPMFIITSKDFVPDGTAPALLYGYGGFNISLTPSFSTSKMCAVRSYGAVYAVANLRGGGEYGETWCAHKHAFTHEKPPHRYIYAYLRTPRTFRHKAGSLAAKQNVFDDFIACAEYLVAQRFTSPAKLAIEGGSNGGLLVAACANQRPALFGAAVAHVGVMDMLRFHRFTIGHAWVTDYGCADASEGEFDTLFRYSPLHNVSIGGGGGADRRYPATLLLTGDHDDRVVPLHTLKLAATLQHAARGAEEAAAGAGAGSAVQQQRAPLLVRVDTKSGHGAGKPTQKVIDEVADVYAFVAKAVGATWRD
jgi:prolyl oligopeptidase